MAFALLVAVLALFYCISVGWADLALGCVVFIFLGLADSALSHKKEH
jgi:hypothetical protein